ncbi:MAG: hypothetical protein JWM44_250 [Bacilli bacterium]|nr:hypothetical protein [Bacilli bacterium]
MYTWLHPIISLLQHLLIFLFGITKDWGLAVIVLTLLVRSSFFFLNLRVARQQVLQKKLQPQLKELREQNGSDALKISSATSKLYRENGVRPFVTILISLLQMPIFMAMYGLFTLHGEMMTSVLVPWVTSLAQSDFLHWIPLIAGVLTFLSSMIPLTSELTASVSVRQRIGISLLTTMIFSLVIWRSPIAVGLYWITSSLYALMERGFYRTRIGKRLLLH